MARNAGAAVVYWRVRAQHLQRKSAACAKKRPNTIKTTYALKIPTDATNIKKQLQITTRDNTKMCATKDGCAEMEIRSIETALRLTAAPRTRMDFMNNSQLLQANICFVRNVLFASG